MRSSASDYFIIYDNQHRFSYGPLRRPAFCGSPPSFAPNREATVVEDDYRGRFFGEPVEHPLSGVNPQSFQPTIGSLADMLWAAGFTEILLLEKSITPDGNGPAVLLKAERSSDTAG
jgi:hypothetical protein